MLRVRAGTPRAWLLSSPLRYHNVTQQVEANFPLFAIFTSGSTGKPKGVVHCHGYVAGVMLTMTTAFDARPGEDTIVSDRLSV